MSEKNEGIYFASNIPESAPLRLSGICKVYSTMARFCLLTLKQSWQVITYPYMQRSQAASSFPVLNINITKYFKEILEKKRNIGKTKKHFFLTQEKPEHKPVSSLRNAQRF